MSPTPTITRRPDRVATPSRDEDRRRLPYLPALDGLRGLAVAAVLLFHSDFSWAAGGHLGVSVFFTLSGFLITGLLLMERDSTGTIALRSFWARRARRLVPAMLVCFGLIALVLVLMDSRPPSGIIGDAIGSATWTANWRFIFAERTYADLFSSPSPFQHFWSLAVEEQFYVVFPLLVGALTARRFLGSRRWPLAALLVVAIAASTIQVARLHQPGEEIARAYYGTDARIAEILVGALLAMVLVAPKGIRALPRRWADVLTGVGGLGLAGLAIGFVTLGDDDVGLYEGGFLGVALCTAAVIASSSQAGSPLGRALAAKPLVQLGRISYGVYLFHWPLFILLDERSTGLDGLGLLALRSIVTVGLAALSFALLESPVRHSRPQRGLAPIGWLNGAVAAVAVVALCSGQLPTAGASGDRELVAMPVPDVARSEGASAMGASPSSTVAGAPSGPVPASSVPTDPVATAPTTTRPAQPDVPDEFAQDPEEAPIYAPPHVPPGALKVAVVGDSVGRNLSEGLEVWAAERGDVAVYRAAVQACPLSRGGERQFPNGRQFAISPECGWWDDPTNERYRVLHEFRPDVVVVQDAVNEIMDRRLPEWEDYRRPGDPRFDNWLRDEYEYAARSWIEAFGATVIMTNAPCADWDRWESFGSIEDVELRVQALNTGVYPGVIEARVVDLFERVCPGGRYSDEVEGVPNGRPDGLHFSDEASAALARNWLGPIILETQQGGPLLPAD